MFGSLYTDVIGDGPNMDNEKSEQAKQGTPAKNVASGCAEPPACSDDDKPDQ